MMGKDELTRLLELEKACIVNGADKKFLMRIQGRIKKLWKGKTCR